MDEQQEEGLRAGAREGRRRWLGYLCYAAGWVSIVATEVAVFALFGEEIGPIGGVLGAVGLLLLSITLLVTAEGFLLPDARQVRAADPRPPVVYLRPFGEDVPLTYDVVSAGESSYPLTAKAEDFLLALNAVGPLVSIAQPDLTSRIGIHLHGAAREYVGEGDWQARIQALLDEAGMVVLAIGDSPGIEWEIQQVRERVGPQSLLLYLPPRPTGALTRKGRVKKEQAVYEQFAPLVERYFGVRMPPFREATYLIGFDDAGVAVMAPDAPCRGWNWTEHDRVKRAVQAQLEAVLARVRPAVELHRYRLPGRAALWVRQAFTLSFLLVTLGLAFGMAGARPLSGAIGALVMQALPGMAVVAGWVMIARYFARLWVWAIPLALGLLTLANMVFMFAPVLGWYDARDLILNLPYQVFTGVLNMAHALAVLALGLSLLGRRADPARGG